MKKFLLTTCTLLLAASAANAQAVLGYTLSESVGTYTPLTDATVLYSGSDESVKDNFDTCIITADGITSSGDSGKGIDLGFTLNFAGNEYTSFLVSTCGYLYLGNDEDIEYNTYMRGNFLTYANDFTIVGMGSQNTVGYLESTEISYKVTGEGENAVLTVQFHDFGMMKSMWDDNPMPCDYQIKIEANGNTSYIYGNFPGDNVNEEWTSYNYRLGLRVMSNYVCATGDLGELKCIQNSVDAVTFTPTTPNGTTVTWNVPVDCVTPEAQPTDMTFDCTSKSLSYNFEAAEGTDCYLVVYTNDDTTVEIEKPVDGVIYEKDQKLGNATVAYYGPSTTGDLYNLDGGVEFKFYVFSANSYGLNGPKYNTVDPLVAETATLPAAPGEVTIKGSTLNSVTIEVATNGTDDDILVIYNSYCERSNYGDHGLFGELTPETKAGDVFPVPEGYTPQYNYEGAPMPENAGTVAYVGKPGEVTISDLEVSTMYYISVYTRNEAGKYTTIPVNTGASTIITYPYDGDSFNFPNYRVPYGWECSETGEGTFGVTDEAYYDRTDYSPTRGTQIMQQRFNLTAGNAVEGKKAWLTPAPIDVNERHLLASFDYSIVEGVSRFQTQPYNEWAEDDSLEIQVSTDNGETWKSLTTYTAENHPEQEELTSYNRISADLNDYRDQTVLVRLYWDTYMTPGFGGNMYIDRFSVEQAEFPEVPVVTMGKVTYNSAVINWVGQQTDYDIECTPDGSMMSQIFKARGTNTWTIPNLSANTKYSVIVRGIITDPETNQVTGYTEWSDPVEFTTTDYPPVDAPENLVSDVETKGADRIAILSWDAAVDAEKYEVAYRLTSATEWTTVETTKTTIEISGLEYSETYVWKVRAFCTHDRETPYSAQDRFTMPEDPMGAVNAISGSVTVSAENGAIIVNGAEGLSVSVYSSAGLNVALIPVANDSETIRLSSGIYIVKVGNATCKVIVK